MKNKLIRSFSCSVLLLSVLYCRSSQAQSTQGWKEMVAGLSQADNTAIEYLVPRISAIPGISYVGYCELHKCVMFLFDPSVYNSEQMLVNVFVDKKIKIYPKANTTIKLITGECTDATTQLLHHE